MHQIVIITDCTDVAANELHAAIWAVNPEIVVAPVVPVEIFSITNGNFAFRLMAEAHPPETVFLSTINPMRVRPKSVIGQTKKGQFFIGRNTGVFDWMTRDFGCQALFDISEQAHNFDPNFRSFVGKLVTAPIAAKLACGASPSDFGPPLPLDEVARLDLADGTIVHIDNFGMMKFTGSVIANEGERLTVTLSDRVVLSATYCRRLMDLETGEWAVFPGSSFGLYELGQVRAHGASSIKAKVDERLTVLPGLYP